jgi:hypothetical protein
MKKIISILIISGLFFIQQNIPANAATKAGGACTKAGITSVASGQTFTCVKSGKKLVWDKVVNKSTITIPAPIPVSATESVVIPISINNLDLKQVPLKAFKNIEQEIKSRPRANFTPNLIVSSLVTQTRKEEEMTGLNRTIDLWAPYFQPNNFNVVYVAGNGDEDWLETKSAELGLNSMLPPGQTWSMRMKMYNPCAFAMAGSRTSVPTFVQCLGRPYSGGVKQTGPHEYTHLFQMGYGGRNAHMLRWYTEGSASYFGWTLGFYPTDPNLSERYYWLSSLYKNLPAEAKSDFESRNLEKFKSRMKMLTPSSDQSIANTSYWVGGLATEVLVALYGFDKFVEFTKNIQSNSDMSFLLMQTYGFDEDYFYEKLAPYVWGQI